MDRPYCKICEGYHSHREPHKFGKEQTQAPNTPRPESPPSDATPKKPEKKPTWLTWRERNREEYNRRQRELMRKRRKESHGRKA